jgi:D-alanyl-D-alanine carboxypeptidase (penicillin-binding protein 5/6)
MRKFWVQLVICVVLFIFTLTSISYAEVQGIGDVTFLELKADMIIETSKVTGNKWTLPYVSAHSAVLLDAQTGDVLYDREAKKQRPPASTTKILTAIVALEMAGLDEMSIVSEKADKVGEASLYLNKGNKIKLGELIEGALIRSGNDACVAIAEQTAGSLDEFIRLMNLKAVSLGACNSNFVNPHGLPDKDHYTTAYDLAIIARYAMTNPVFSKIVGQKISSIDFEQPLKSQIAKNTNKLLWNYPFADGIKTGTTNAAGKCLVASASKEGRRLICVLLNAPDRFGDAQRLLEWGFNYTEIVAMGKKGDFITNCPGYGSSIPIILGEDVFFCVEKVKKDDLRVQVEFIRGIYPPIKAGDVLGNYSILIGDKVLKKASLKSQFDYVGSPINFSGTLNLFVERVLDLWEKKG